MASNCAACASIAATSQTCCRSSRRWARLQKARRFSRTFEHVRLKESDRVAAMLQLNRMGGTLELHDDRLVAHGVSQLFGARALFLQRPPHPDVARGRGLAGRRTKHADLSERVPHLVSALSRGDAQHRRSDVDLRRDRQTAGALKPKPAAPMLKPDRAAQLTLDELLRRHAAKCRRWSSPSSKRAKAATRRLTWQELLRSSRPHGDAAAAARRSVRARRVAFQLPNCIEFVVVALATLRIGAICCPLMPIFREREVAFCLRRSRARVLVRAGRSARPPSRGRDRRHAHRSLDLQRQPAAAARARHRLDERSQSHPLAGRRQRRRIGALAALSRGAGEHRGRRRSCSTRAPPHRRRSRSCSSRREPRASRKACCIATTC